MSGDSERDAMRAARRVLAERLADRGIEDRRVLDAIDQVPRHRFVPEALQAQAYLDHALPIGHGQTISQPFVVARMTEALGIEPGDRVLEVGTGSGYQAAVLGELAAEVYTIEIVAPLAEQARATLDDLGYDNVHVRTGDGYRGWPEHAPFDAILVTAAPEEVPQPLIEQLKVGDHLVVPVGTGLQQLMRLTKTEAGLTERMLGPVLFVPMTGEAQRKKER